VTKTRPVAVATFSEAGEDVNRWVTIPCGPAVQAQAQGDVVVDAAAGERAEQDQEWEQRDQ
jgi:hypothetical protein